MLFPTCCSCRMPAGLGPSWSAPSGNSRAPTKGICVGRERSRKEQVHMPIDRTEDSGLFVVKESTCWSIEQLSELLDGSIEPAAAAAMRNHIRQCPFCRNELAMLVEFDEGRIEPKDLEVIEWMTKKLHRRVSREIGKTPGQESTFQRAKRLASRFSLPK